MPTEELKLPLTFIHRDMPQNKYLATENPDSEYGVIVSWDDETFGVGSATYSIASFVKHIREGVWVVITPPTPNEAKRHILTQRDKWILERAKKVISICIEDLKHEVRKANIEIELVSHIKKELKD